MRFLGLDLNLLVALEALLRERSVSLAADRLHLSQSATSGALGRLREYFGDELLVLQGRQLVLTARGEELIAPVEGVLSTIREIITVATPFDPLASDRTVTVMASDYVTEVLLRPALLAFAAEAPGMTFEIAVLADDLVEELQRGRADILITIDTAITTELPHSFLFEEDYVVVGWNGNPQLGDSMTMELYQALGHVGVKFGRTRSASFEDWVIRSRSISRRVEVVAPNFASVAGLLVGTERISTMHRRLAARLSQYLPLTILPVPFDIPAIRQAAQWNSRAAADPAVLWVVQRLREIASAPGF